jgi:hypothetical protein
MLMHQELEEHFLSPISRKLAQKTNGPGYNGYLQARASAIADFDSHVRPTDTFREDLPPIPVLNVSLAELEDPIVRYRKAAAKEQELSTFIAQATDQWTPPPDFASGDVMDLKKWKILAETRFYEGKTDVLPPKGKRIIVPSFQGSLSRDMDAFAPPEPRRVRVRDRVPAASIDHLSLGVS